MSQLPNVTIGKCLNCQISQLENVILYAYRHILFLYYFYNFHWYYKGVGIDRPSADMGLIFIPVPIFSCPCDNKAVSCGMGCHTECCNA